MTKTDTATTKAASKPSKGETTTVRTPEFDITFSWDIPMAEMTAVALAFRRGPLRGLVLRGAFHVVQERRGIYWLQRDDALLQRPWPTNPAGHPDMHWLRAAFLKAQRRAGRVDFKGKARWVNAF